MLHPAASDSGRGSGEAMAVAVALETIACGWLVVGYCGRMIAKDGISKKPQQKLILLGVWQKHVIT